MRLVHPRGALTGPEDGDLVALTPQEAGWSYAGLRVVALLPGVERTVRTGDAEVFVLPLSGGLRVTVTAEAAPDESEATYDLVGRDSVFTPRDGLRLRRTGQRADAAQRGRRRGRAAVGGSASGGGHRRTGRPRTCRSRCAGRGERPGR